MDLELLAAKLELATRRRLRDRWAAEAAVTAARTVAAPRVRVRRRPSRPAADAAAQRMLAELRQGPGGWY